MVQGEPWGLHGFFSGCSALFLGHRSLSFLCRWKSGHWIQWNNLLNVIFVILRYHVRSGILCPRGVWRWRVITDKINREAVTSQGQHYRTRVLASEYQCQYGWSCQSYGGMLGKINKTEYCILFYFLNFFLWRSPVTRPKRPLKVTQREATKEK